MKPIRNKKPSARLLRLLKRELRSGERLIWSVRPDPRVLARREHSFLLSIFWVLWLAIMTSPALVAGLTGSVVWLLVLAPVWAMIAYWFVRKRTRERERARATLYAITNRRAIVLVAWQGLDVSSFYLDDIVKVVRRERRNGTGDLILRQELVLAGDGTVLKEDGFVALYRPRRVERLLEQARLDARAAKPSPERRSSVKTPP